MRIIEKGGINTPKGFLAAGIACGIKTRKKDLSLILSEYPCQMAAAFTTNIVKAAPVLYNQEIYESNTPVRCILTNSGNANACTAQQGFDNTREMAQATALELGLRPEEVMVNSTGVIGVQLPMDKILDGIKMITKMPDRSAESAESAAFGILTTDTSTKTICVEIMLGDTPVTIAAIAKGSGMIHPNMATMLSFITTDVRVEQSVLRALLQESILDSYNMLSVDGDTSTNDTVIVLANGAAENDLLQTDTEDFQKFKEAFDYVNRKLAIMIAMDGEGATKLLFVDVQHAQTKDDARKIAMSVVQSSLVKTAIFGEDANWGRVLCAMGYAKAAFDPNHVVLQFQSKKGTIKLFENGMPIVFDEEEALAILKEYEITIQIDLNQGDQSAQAFGCDLSYEYVRINGEYRS